MKFTSKILSVALLALACVGVQAQNGFDYFSIPRAATLAPVTITTTNVVSTLPIDIRPMMGTARLDMFAVTNGDAITATIQTSDDLTNWVSISAYALATSTTIKYTNTAYGSTMVGTNTYLLPGSIVTPVAATAGFATPYMSPAQFTNTTAVTMGLTGLYSVGIPIDDCKRYLRVTWTPGASATSTTVGGLLIGRLQQFP